MSWDRKQLESDRTTKLVRQSADEDLKSLSLDFLKKSYQFDYCYQWNWAGFPILNMPEDIVAYQEILFRCKPTVVIETGVAWGGSIALAASIMSLYEPTGQVLGIDKNLDEELLFQLRDLNLSVRIELLQSNSTEESALDWVAERLTESDKVMVVLDSHHTHDHVLSELRVFSSFVTSGQFLIVGDTIVKDLANDTDRVRPWSHKQNPHSALEEFLSESSDFVRDDQVNRKLLTSFHPGGYIRKV
jgi:cephalosporin hydroxylase